MHFMPVPKELLLLADDSRRCPVALLLPFSVLLITHVFLHSPTSIVVVVPRRDETRATLRQREGGAHDDEKVNDWSSFGLSENPKKVMKDVGWDPGLAQNDLQKGSRSMAHQLKTITSYALKKHIYLHICWHDAGRTQSTNEQVEFTHVPQPLEELPLENIYTESFSFFKIK